MRARQSRPELPSSRVPGGLLEPGQVCPKNWGSLFVYRVFGLDLDFPLQTANKEQG